MSVEKALAFLRAHQPMPNEADLKQDEIDEYDEVRRFFTQNPDPRCVRLFLGSFGEGTCYGVYQLVDDVLRSHSPDLVVQGLKEALGSELLSVRTWSLQMAMGYPREDLRPHVEPLRGSQDEDERFWAEEFVKMLDKSKM